MTDQQHTVICGDGSIARFSTPERATGYERLRREGAVIEGLRWLSYGVLALAAILAAIKAGGTAVSDPTKEAVVIIPKDQLIKFTITPLPGRLMSAKAIGGQLSALYDLYKEIGRDEAPPMKIHTSIIGICMKDDGSIEFDLAVMEEKTCAEVDAAIAVERSAAK